MRRGPRCRTGRARVSPICGSAAHSSRGRVKRAAFPDVSAPALVVRIAAGSGVKWVYCHRVPSRWAKRCRLRLHRACATWASAIASWRHSTTPTVSATTGGFRQRRRAAVRNQRLCAAQRAGLRAASCTSYRVTHRHRDHISGFSTDGEGTGKIIAACQPDHVILPWTEDPQDQFRGHAAARYRTCGLPGQSLRDLPLRTKSPAGILCGSLNAVRHRLTLIPR
jgi:hypothetical protein